MSRKTAATMAEQAREIQRLAPVGSNRRKAAGVAAIVLSNARSMAGARRILTRHRLPGEIRTAALQLLAELEAADAEGTSA